MTESRDVRPANGPLPTLPTRERVLQPERWAGGRTERVVSLLQRLGGARQSVPWPPIVVVILIVGVGIWTKHAVRSSLETITAEKLRVVLDADIAALEIWIDAQIELVESWAEKVSGGAELETLRNLARESDDTTAALTGAPELRSVQEILQPITRIEGTRGYVIIDRSGTVLAGDGEAAFIGHRVAPDVVELLAGVFAGRSDMIRSPVHINWLTGEPLPIIDRKGLAVPIMPLIGLAAPLRDSRGEIVAVIVLQVDPDHDFTRILSVARLGTSGETYAFNRQGVMLSESRFEQSLRDNDMLPADDEGTHYALVLRDPGGDVTRGFEPSGPADSRPFTRMAASAMTGQSGVDVDGYRDYRGVRVVGAWQWLDDYDFGVATEVNESEAYGALRPVNIAFGVLATVLGVALLLILLSAWSLRVMSRRVDEVQQLGQYTLEKKIGEGGMGAVYRASHAMLRRPTAVKLLRPDVVNEENLARFEREVQLTSRLRHPNTIDVYDYGRSPDGTFYYAMELLDGLTLTQLMERCGALSPARAVYLLRQACGSLEEAHSIGLVHRDIKPLNIMTCRFGLRTDVVKVLDFGLVKEVDTPKELEVTSPDLVGGTPPYIPPERLKDPRCSDPRSDLYSIGAVAFNLLTGRPTFDGLTAMEIVYKVINDEPKRPSEHVEQSIPPALDQLVFECLARKADDRPASATVILERLDAIEGLGEWGPEQARAWWEGEE